MQIMACKIELFVRDLSQSLNFYQDVLGFEAGEIRFVIKDGHRLDHAPISNGAVLIGLGRYDDLPEDHHFRQAVEDMQMGVGTELCFYVSAAELDGWYQRAMERYDSAKIEPLSMRPWGARDFRVIDPDGYYLRISEPDKDHHV